MVIEELKDYGVDSCCSQLNFKYRACFELVLFLASVLCSYYNQHICLCVFFLDRALSSANQFRGAALNILSLFLNLVVIKSLIYSSAH